MLREIAVGGLFFPALLLLFILSLALHTILDGVAARYGWYRHLWYPALFRVSVFVCIFSVLGFLLLHGGWV